MTNLTNTRPPAQLQANADTLSNRITTGLAASQGVLMENLGTIIAISVDVLIGFIALVLMTRADLQPGDFLSWLLWGVSGALSFLTSAVQYVFWKIIFTVPNWWHKIGLLMPVLALMILDTGMDSSLTNWLIYRRSPLSLLLPADQVDPGYYVVFFMILIATGFNEPLVYIFRYRETLLGNIKSKKKNKAPRPPRSNNRTPRATKTQRPTAHQKTPTWSPDRSNTRR
jgi:hypothetical protein